MTDRPRRRPALLPSALVAVVFISAACTGSDPGSGDTTDVVGDAVISQPAVEGFDVAAEEDRVDLELPTFSDPTNITNPLFPVSSQESVLLLGRVEGQAFRTEVTLLPEPRIIEWEGMQVPALMSQYVAFLDGRLHEVAYDFYAQADDGSVWYFGEDVFNFSNGAIVDTHGTWLAGKDGPAAMIMPADPQVGDVYRPENIPGFVFEEVTVQKVDETIEGHLGRIDGALVIEEFHMDGATEMKTFAPDYGEYYTAADGEVEALDLAVPTDALAEPVPDELDILARTWREVFNTSGAGKWGGAARNLEVMDAAWKSYRAGEVPRRLGPSMTASLARLERAIGSRSVHDTRQAAIDVAQWTFDLQLRHRPVTEVDLARFDLWLARLTVDAAAGDESSVNGDFFALDYIRDRILHVLDEALVTDINSRLEALAEAVAEGELEDAAAAAQKLRRTLPM